jgi:crotonobetainyl-CoA:carnitine CoA-transferase CaiB-like acyl-CoA transferase
MAGALEGVKVLEVCSFITGPYAGMLLADMGAEVIKVEDPKRGDPFRGWEMGGDSPTFWSYNRGKKSVTLNLRTPEAREIFYQLCRDRDVVIENFRPGTTKKLAIDYESLRPFNERLIYCSVTGMGPSGPYANRPAYDTVGQGLSGLSSLLMERDSLRPIGPNFSDSLGGVFGAFGVLGALYARERTGRGQHVSTSMVAATLGFLIDPATKYLATGEVPGPISRPRASQTYAFVASDGLPFAIHLSTPPKFWEGMARASGHPGLIEDPRFKTVDDRRRNYHELQQTLGKILKEKPRSYWLEKLVAEDVPHTPIYNMAELFQDPQLEHMGMKIEIPRGERAPIRTVRFPIDYSETPPPHPGPPPDLGQHTHETLKGLGYETEQIAALKEKGVI